MVTSCFPPRGSKSTAPSRNDGATFLFAAFIALLLLVVLSSSGCYHSDVVRSDTPQGSTKVTRRGLTPLVRTSDTVINTQLAYEACVAQFGQPTKGNPAWQWMFDEMAKQWAWRCREDARGGAYGAVPGYPGAMPVMAPTMAPPFGVPPFGYGSPYGAVAVDPAGNPAYAQAVVNAAAMQDAAKAQGVGYGSPLQVVTPGKGSGDEEAYRRAAGAQAQKDRDRIAALEKALKDKKGKKGKKTADPDPDDGDDDAADADDKP